MAFEIIAPHRYQILHRLAAIRMVSYPHNSCFAVTY